MFLQEACKVPCLRRLLSSLLTPILVSYPFNLNLLTLGYLVFFVGLGVSFSSLKNHKDHEIRDLVSELPSILLLDKAPNTVKRYFGAFQKWERWAKSKCISSIPASPEFFSLFLISLIKTCSSFSAFNAVVPGVSWAHLKFGLTPLLAFPIAKQIVQAAKRIFGKAPRNRKLPLQRNHIRLLQDKFAFGDLAQLQIVTLITIGFGGFLRWDDLSRLKYSDLRFDSNYIAVFLEKRKNDQFREGSWIFIAASYSRYCPVILLQRFLSKGNHSNNSFLFRRVSHTKNGMKLRKEKLSYLRALDLVRKQLRAISLDPQQFGLHSLRSGGASLAAAMGIPDRLIMRHGGWKSESSKNRYIQESVDSLLAISRAHSL